MICFFVFTKITTVLCIVQSVLYKINEVDVSKRCYELSSEGIHSLTDCIITCNMRNLTAVYKNGRYFCLEEEKCITNPTSDTVKIHVYRAASEYQFIFCLAATTYHPRKKLYCSSLFVSNLENL